MLDRSRERTAPPWARTAAPFIAAGIAIAATIYLTLSSIDYARNGCDCDSPWYPDWIWIVTASLAALCSVAAAALLWRGVDRWRHRCEL